MSQFILLSYVDETSKFSVDKTGPWSPVLEIEPGSYVLLGAELRSWLPMMTRTFVTITSCYYPAPLECGTCWTCDICNILMIINIMTKTTFLCHQYWCHRADCEPAWDTRIMARPSSLSSYLFNMIVRRYFIKVLCGWRGRGQGQA